MFPLADFSASLLVLFGLTRILKSRKSSTLEHLKRILMELRGFSPAKLFHLLKQNKSNHDISAILHQLKMKSHEGKNTLLFTSRALQLILTLEKHLSKTRHLKKAIFMRHFVILGLLLLAKIFLVGFMPAAQLENDFPENSLLTGTLLAAAVLIQLLSARFTKLMIPRSWIGSFALSPRALSWIFMDIDPKIDAENFPWKKDFDEIKWLEIDSGTSMHQDRTLILNLWHDILEYDYHSKFESFGEKFPAVEFLTFLILSSLWLGPTMLALMISLPTP